MTKGPKKWKEPQEELEEVASAAECTGLIPAALADEQEAEAYRELYPIHKQIPTK